MRWGQVSGAGLLAGTRFEVGRWASPLEVSCSDVSFILETQDVWTGFFRTGNILKVTQLKVTADITKKALQVHLLLTANKHLYLHVLIDSYSPTRWVLDGHVDFLSTSQLPLERIRSWTSHFQLASFSCH